MDLKGILNTLRKELHQPRNALTMQLLLSLRRTNKIAVFVSFSRSYCHQFICNFETISCGFTVNVKNVHKKVLKVDGTSFPDAGSLVKTAHVTREICPRDLKYRKSKTNMAAQKL